MFLAVTNRRNRSPSPSMAAWKISGLLKKWSNIGRSTLQTVTAVPVCEECRPVETRSSNSFFVESCSYRTKVCITGTYRSCGTPLHMLWWEIRLPALVDPSCSTAFWPVGTSLAASELSRSIIWGIVDILLRTAVIDSRYPCNFYFGLTSLSWDCNLSVR